MQDSYTSYIQRPILESSASTNHSANFVGKPRKLFRATRVFKEGDLFKQVKDY